MKIVPKENKSAGELRDEREAAHKEKQEMARKEIPIIEKLLESAKNTGAKQYYTQVLNAFKIYVDHHIGDCTYTVSVESQNRFWENFTLPFHERKISIPEYSKAVRHHLRTEGEILSGKDYTEEEIKEYENCTKYILTWYLQKNFGIMFKLNGEKLAPVVDTDRLTLEQGRLLSYLLEQWILTRDFSTTDPKAFMAEIFS